MADKDKFKQFIDELQKVVGQDLLPRDMLEFAQDMLIVGRDMVNSQVVIGDHNVINYYPQTESTEKGVEEDEQSLVAKALTTHLGELKAEQNTVSENPYPGLLAYRLQDASHFFGRKQTVIELMTELEQRRVIWLHGRSGTGKSSLIQAGLMPALLEKKAVPVLVRNFDE
jgi:ABC-type multidrug transport system fused ATPase/permease subunit